MNGAGDNSGDGSCRRDAPASATIHVVDATAPAPAAPAQPTVTGPHNQSVTVTQNGSPLYYFGDTDWQGVWWTGGTWGPGSEGAYSQTWYVDGVQADPILTITVAP